MMDNFLIYAFCIYFKDAYFKAMSQFQEYFGLTQGKDWKLTTNVSDFSKKDNDRIQAIKKHNVEESIKHLIDDRMFKDACIHLGRIYNIISNRFAKDPAEKIDYLSKTHEVCKSSKLLISVSSVRTKTKPHLIVLLRFHKNIGRPVESDIGQRLFRMWPTQDCHLVLRKLLRDFQERKRSGKLWQGIGGVGQMQ